MAMEQAKEPSAASDYIAKSGKEKRSIIADIIRGSHGKTKTELDHDKVQEMVRDAFLHESTNPYFSLMLEAMADVGCAIDMETNVIVKRCGEDDEYKMGSFNRDTNQLEIYQDTFVNGQLPRKRLAMQTTLSHMLVEAYDHCRANLSSSKPEHDMCTAIRSAALSGVCSSDVQMLNKAQLASSKRGYQTCVLRRAVENFLSRNPSWDLDQTKDLVRKVFPTCFHDHSPHDRLPYDAKQAELSYKAYITRSRYQC